MRVFRNLAENLKIGRTITEVMDLLEFDFIELSGSTEAVTVSVNKKLTESEYVDTVRELMKKDNEENPSWKGETVKDCDLEVLVTSNVHEGIFEGVVTSSTNDNYPVGEYSEQWIEEFFELCKK